MENSNTKSAKAVTEPKPAQLAAVSKKTVKPSVKKAIASVPTAAKKAAPVKRKRTKGVPRMSLLEKLHGLEPIQNAPRPDNSWTKKFVRLMADEYVSLTTGRGSGAKSHIENATKLVDELDKPFSRKFLSQLIDVGAPAWVVQKLGSEPVGVVLEAFADRSNTDPLVHRLEKDSTEKSFYDMIAKYAYELGAGNAPAIFSSMLSTLSESVLPWLSSYVPALALAGKRQATRDIYIEPDSSNPRAVISKRYLGAIDTGSYHPVPNSDEKQPIDVRYDYDPRKGNPDRMSGIQEADEDTGRWYSDSKGSYYQAGTVRLLPITDKLSMPSVYAGFNSHLDARQITRFEPLPHSLYGSDGVVIEGFQTLCEIRNETGGVNNPDGLGIMFPVSGFADVENSGYFIKRGIKLNPINLGGRLSNIASQYNRYRYTDVKICYCPGVGTVTPGQFALSYVSDPGMYESIPGGTYMDYAAITQTQPSKKKGPMILAPFQRAMDDDLAGIHCLHPDLGRQDELFYCDEAVVNETPADARQINQGVICAVSEDPGSQAEPGTKWGTVYVYWTVHLVDPVPLIREAAIMRQIRVKCGNYAYEQFLQSISTVTTLFPLMRSLGIVRNPDDDSGRTSLSGLLEDLKRLNVVPSGCVYNATVPEYWEWLAANPFTGDLVTQADTCPLPLIKNISCPAVDLVVAAKDKSASTFVLIKSPVDGSQPAINRTKATN